MWQSPVSGLALRGRCDGCNILSSQKFEMMRADAWIWSTYRSKVVDVVDWAAAAMSSGIDFGAVPLELTEHVTKRMLGTGTCILSLLIRWRQR